MKPQNEMELLLREILDVIPSIKDQLETHISDMDRDEHQYYVEYIEENIRKVKEWSSKVKNLLK